MQVMICNSCCGVWMLSSPFGSGCLECSWTDWTDWSGHLNWNRSPEVQPFLIRAMMMKMIGIVYGWSFMPYFNHDYLWHFLWWLFAPPIDYCKYGLFPLHHFWIEIEINCDGNEICEICETKTPHYIRLSPHNWHVHLFVWSLYAHWPLTGSKMRPPGHVIVLGWPSTQKLNLSQICQKKSCFHILCQWTVFMKLFIVHIWKSWFTVSSGWAK